MLGNAKNGIIRFFIKPVAHCLKSVNIFDPELRLIHITAFSACVCGRLLRCSAEIEKFLSLR